MKALAEKRRSCDLRELLMQTGFNVMYEHPYPQKLWISQLKVRRL